MRSLGILELLLPPPLLLAAEGSSSTADSTAAAAAWGAAAAAAAAAAGEATITGCVVATHETGQIIARRDDAAHVRRLVEPRAGRVRGGGRGSGRSGNASDEERRVAAGGLDATGGVDVAGRGAVSPVGTAAAASLAGHHRECKLCLPGRRPG